MGSSIRFLLFSTISMVLISCSAANPPSKLVQEFCKKNENPGNADCLSALQPDPRIATVSNYRELAEIALNLAIGNTTDSKKFIENMMKRKETNPALVHELKTCLNEYGAAVNSFKSALGELKEDAMTASYDAKVASDGAMTCETALNSTNLPIPPEISTRNTHLRLYSFLSFDIISKFG